jgi:hypothetical protein
MICLDVARGSRAVVAALALCLPCILSSCGEDPVTVAPKATPGDQLHVTLQMDARPEGIFEIDTAGPTTIAVSSRATYRLVDGSWKSVAPGLWNYRGLSVTHMGTIFGLDNLELVRLDDNSWTHLSALRPSGDYSLDAMWAYDDTHIFVTTSEYDDYYFGDVYTLYEFNGTKWAGYDLPGHVNDIWGPAPDDLYMVGPKGLVLHFDGTSTTTFASVTGNNLRAVWGSSANDVYAVGDQGKVVHFDGVNWTGLSRPTTQSLRTVRVIDGSLFVGGERGACVRYNAGAWESISVPSPGPITGIARDEATGGIFAGSTSGILDFNQGHWRHAAGTCSGGLRAVWVAETGDVFAVGHEGVIEQRDASGWQPAYFGGPQDVWNALGGNSASDVYAVGDSGKFIHYDGNAWTPVNSGTTAQFNAIWVSPGDVIMAGDSEIREWENGTVQPMAGGFTGGAIHDVWGLSRNSLFAVGNRGLILHFDGGEWRRMDWGGTVRLWAVWGRAADDVFVAGEGAPFYGATRYYAGTMLHYDGATWRRLESEGVRSVATLWGSANDGLLGLSGDQLCALEGHQWVPLPVGIADVSAADMYGASGGDIYLVGTGVARMHVERRR